MANMLYHAAGVDGNTRFTTNAAVANINNTSSAWTMAFVCKIDSLSVAADIGGPSDVLGSDVNAFMD